MPYANLIRSGSELMSVAREPPLVVDMLALPLSQEGR